MCASLYPRSITDIVGVWNSFLYSMPSLGNYLTTVAVNPQTLASATPEAIVTSTAMTTIYATVQPVIVGQNTVNQVVLSPDSVLAVPTATDRRIVAYGTMPDFNTVQFTNALCNIAALTVAARGNCNLTPTPFNAIWTRNSSASVSASATTVVTSGPMMMTPMNSGMMTPMMMVPMHPGMLGTPSRNTLQTPATQMMMMVPMNSLSPAPIPVNPVASLPPATAFRRVTTIQHRTPFCSPLDPEKYTLHKLPLKNKLHFTRRK